MSDWANVFLLLGISTFGSALISGFLWYLSNTFDMLLAFSILFGLFAGGYSVLWPRFIAVLTENPATGLWLYGLLAFQRGLGNILAGPISVALLKMMAKFVREDEAAAYRPLILFVVATLVISSFGGFGFFCRKNKGTGTASRGIAHRPTISSPLQHQPSQQQIFNATDPYIPSQRKLPILTPTRPSPTAFV